MIGIIVISTISVGISLFDSNYKSGIVGFVVIAGIAGFFVIAVVAILLLLVAVALIMDTKQSTRLQKLESTISIRFKEFNTYVELKDWDHVYFILEELTYITSQLKGRYFMRFKLQQLNDLFFRLQDKDSILSLIAELNYKDVEYILSMLEKLINIIPQLKQETHSILQILRDIYGKLQWQNYAPLESVQLVKKDLKRAYELLLSLVLTSELQKHIHPELQELKSICCELQQRNDRFLLEQLMRDNNCSKISSILSNITMQGGLEALDIKLL